MLCMAACAALAADLKIGAVMLGDETEGYTLAHMEGIKQAAAELGLSDSIVWKYKVPEDQTCYDSALDLVGQGCNPVSYTHLDVYKRQLKECLSPAFFSLYHSAVHRARENENFPTTSRRKSIHFLTGG